MSGRDARVLAGEHPAGAAESGEHFVGDHQRAEAVAERADAGQKLRRPHDHAARALQHRLDEHGRRLSPDAPRGAARDRQGNRCGTSRDRVRAGSDSSTARARARPENSSGVNARVKTDSSLTDIAPTVSP